MCETQAGRDNRANTGKPMTGPEDAVRGAYEMIAGSGLDGRYLEGIARRRERVWGASWVTHGEVGELTRAK